MPSALPFPIYQDVRNWTGDPQIPREIKNLRQSTIGAMRRVGTPALLKRVYTQKDVDQGKAQDLRDTVYRQVRHKDALTNGIGLASIDTQPGEWYDADANQIVTGDIDGPPPRDGLLPAPRYRGYGPGFLAYVILPDRPEDVFRITPQGVLTQTQDAKVQLPWWPIVGDNDLLIPVALDDAGRILEAFERYELKQVVPITMRGTDRSGRRESAAGLAGGNRHWVGQECEAVKLPDYEVAYQVETDR